MTTDRTQRSLKRAPERHTAHRAEPRTTYPHTHLCGQPCCDARWLCEDRQCSRIVYERCDRCRDMEDIAAEDFYE